MVNFNGLLRLMEANSMSGEEDFQWKDESEEPYKRRLNFKQNITKWMGLHLINILSLLEDRKRQLVKNTKV